MKRGAMGRGEVWKLLDRGEGRSNPKQVWDAECSLEGEIQGFGVKEKVREE
jgi:hypothetical protein